MFFFSPPVVSHVPPLFGFLSCVFFLSRSSDNTLVPIFLSNKNVLAHRVAQAQVTKFLLEFHGKTKQNIKQPYTRVRGEKRRGRAGEEEEERREKRREGSYFLWFLRLCLMHF